MKRKTTTTPTSCSANCSCDQFKAGPVLVEIGQPPPGCDCDTSRLIAVIENLVDRTDAEREAEEALRTAEERTTAAVRDVARQLERTVGLNRWVQWGEIAYRAYRPFRHRLALETRTVTQ